MSKSYEGPIQPDDWVGKVVPDPENPDVRRVVGFGLGESDRPAYWRLYLNSDLTEYLEFRKEDCLHAKQLESGGYTVAWLKPDAKIAHTRTQEAALEFLRGDIRSRFLGSTRFAVTGGGGVGGGGLGFTKGPQCCCLTIKREFQTSDLCGPA